MRVESNGGQGDPGVRVDVVILTALDVEYRAVREHLDEVRTVPGERGSRFEVGVVRGDHGDRLVAIHLTGPGNPVAAAVVERVVTRFDPDVILFVGVAGGRKDVALGDVVAADTVYDYETGKDTERGFLPRHKTHQSAHRLVQDARHIAAVDRWPERVRASAETRPRAHVKPIAAGGRVITSMASEAARKLARSAGDAVAVEMEGYGFLAGAHLNQRVAALVIRGISDLLADKDEAHDERWQPIAAGHAAAFAVELVSGLAPGNGTGVAAVPRQPARAPRRTRLGIAELGELTRLLLAVPGLSAPSRWQQLLDELPSVGTAVSRQSASRPEALALLRACDDHGAWGELLDVITLISPDAPAAAELARRVTELGLR